jgi:uncharacterized protein
MGWQRSNDCSTGGMALNQSSEKPLAVVTGASSGIGLELARQFAQNGFDLLIASQQPRIAEAEAALAKAGASVESVTADLSAYDGVETLYERIVSPGRPVDGIAINAGIGVSGDFARVTSLASELRLIQLNIVCPVHLTKRVLKDMLQAGRGRILFTSSVAGTMPTPFEAVYGASKAFLTSFAQAVRNELKDTGITVTVLMPRGDENRFLSPRRYGKHETRGIGKRRPCRGCARRFQSVNGGQGPCGGGFSEE